METVEQDTLPALIIQVEGRVVSTNLDDFASHGRAMIAKINTDPKTDDEFDVAAKVVKRCEESEKLIDTVTAQALGQMASVDQLVKTMAALKEEFRQTRLKLSKKVTENKEAGKAAIVNEAVAAYVEHVRALNQDLGGALVTLTDTERFKNTIKGLSSFASMRERVTAALEAARAEANAVALLITANRKAMEGSEFLVPDFASVCTKARDDFDAMVLSRLAAHRQREEQEAKRKLQEEADRITREAAHKDAQEKAQKDQAERDALAKATTPAPAVAPAVAVPAAVSDIERTPSPYSANELILIDALRKVRALVKPEGEASRIIDVALYQVHAE